MNKRILLLSEVDRSGYVLRWRCKYPFFRSNTKLPFQPYNYPYLHVYRLVNYNSIRNKYLHYAFIALMHVCLSRLLKFQAHALYNSIAVRDKTEKWSPLIYKTQKVFWKGNSSITFQQHCDIAQKMDTQLVSARVKARDTLTALRLHELSESLNSADHDNMDKISNFTQLAKTASIQCTDDITKLASNLVDTAVQILTPTPPCPFLVVALGSLARGEATPYSDLEYMFLIEQSTPETEKYFELLAVTTYFLIGNFQETNLAYMAIEELMGWFEDGAKDGFKIDGLQESAGNIPTGNGEAGSMTPDQFL